MSTLSTGISTFLAFVVEVATLVVALTIVRSKRPDVAVFVAVFAGIHIFATVAWSFITTFVTPVLVRESPENMASVYAVLTIVTALFRTIAWGALLVGLVKIANPPNNAPYDPTRF